MNSRRVKTDWIACWGSLVLLSLLAPTVFANKSEQYSASEIQGALNQVARDMNRNLPRMLDAEIRLDLVEPGDREMRFKYTVINWVAAQVDRNVFLKKTHKRMLENFCNGETRDVFVEYGVMLNYIYYGNDGKEIVRLKLDPRKCQ